MKHIVLLLLSTAIYALDMSVITEHMPNGVVDESRPLDITTTGNLFVIRILSKSTFDETIYRNVVTVEDRGCYVAMTTNDRVMENFTSTLKVTKGRQFTEEWTVNKIKVHVLFVDGNDNLLEKFRDSFNK